MTDENEENCFECQYCNLTFDSSDERDNHVFSTHYKEVEDNLAKIQHIAEEPSNKQTIQEWKDEKRKELLLKIATERPQLLHEIQTSPHADEMLSKLIEMDLFKQALRVETLSSFDAMWLKHPRFEEFYRASKEKPKHYSDPQSGQSEQTIPIDSPSAEADKVLEKKTPVNKVRFKDGELILEPEYEPERFPRNIKYAGNREDLSDRKRLEVLLVLKALMRKRSSN
jgi:hypothetical protein